MQYQVKCLSIYLIALELLSSVNSSVAEDSDGPKKQVIRNLRLRNNLRRGSWSERIGSGGNQGLGRTSSESRIVRDQFNFYNIRPSSGQNIRPNYENPPDDAEDLDRPPYQPYQEQTPTPYQPNTPYRPYQQPQPNRPCTPNQPNQQYPPNQPYQPYQQYQPQPYPPYQPNPNGPAYPPYSAPQEQYTYPPIPTSTTTTPKPETSESSPSTPIGYMLIDTYTSAQGTSYSQPVAFFIRS